MGAGAFFAFFLRGPVVDGPGELERCRFRELEALGGMVS